MKTKEEEIFSILETEIETELGRLDMWKWIKALNPFAVQLRNTEARLEFARVLLAQAEIELADKAFYVREFAAVSQERDGLKAEIATLRERASVPVPAGVPSGAPLPTIQRMAENQGYSTAPPAMPTPLPSTIEVLDFDPPADQVEALARVFRDEHAKVMGTDALSYGLTLFCAYARAAIAHLAKRPEGLPTAEQLKAAHMKYVESYRKGENDGSMCATDFALEYLTPFLRQSVGWELDVTADVIEVIARSSSRQTRAKEILDLCRARIRPIYECKECRQWRNANDELVRRATAARAALEGE